MVSCCSGLAVMAQEANSWDPSSTPGRDTSWRPWIFLSPLRPLTPTGFPLHQGACENVAKPTDSLLHICLWWYGYTQIFRPFVHLFVFLWSMSNFWTSVCESKVVGRSLSYVWMFSWAMVQQDSLLCIDPMKCKKGGKRIHSMILLWSPFKKRNSNRHQPLQHT